MLKINSSNFDKNSYKANLELFQIHFNPAQSSSDIYIPSSYYSASWSSSPGRSTLRMRQMLPD